MEMRKNENIWTWLIAAEDSSVRWSDTSRHRNRKRSILSIVKVIFWYGAAISFSVFISRLH